MSHRPKHPKYEVSQGEIKSMLQACGAQLEGESHQQRWFNPKKLTRSPLIVDGLVRAIKERWYDFKPQIVVAAAPRALILGHHLALHFSLQGRTTEFIYLEDGPDGYYFPEEDSKAVTGRMVLIFDDVIRTGKTAKAMIDPVMKAGGHVLGITSVVDHGLVTPSDMGVSKLVSLYRLEQESRDDQHKLIDALPA